MQLKTEWLQLIDTNVRKQSSLCENAEFQTENAGAKKNDPSDQATPCDRDAGKGRVTIANVVYLSFYTGSVFNSPRPPLFFPPARKFRAIELYRLKGLNEAKRT